MYRRCIGPEVKGSLDDDGDGWRLVSALSAFVPARTASVVIQFSVRGGQETNAGKVWIRGPGAGG